MVHIEGQRTLATVPDWATKQRRLIELLDGVPDLFLDRHFEDGEPYWPPEDHVGIDGGDDLYEGFHNWPLLYMVGADEAFLDGSKTAFDGIAPDVRCPLGTGRRRPRVEGRHLIRS